MTAPILCVGAALWDVVARTDRALSRGADVPGRIERQPGGVALNVALALAALGRPVRLLSAVGRDAAGEELLAEATRRGVDCAHVARHDGPSDAYLAIEDAAGEVFAAVADCAALERAGAAVTAPAVAGPLAPWTGAAVVDGNLPTALLAEIAGGAAFARARPLAFVPASPGKAERLAALLAAGRGALYLNRGEAEGACGQRFADAATAAWALVARGLPEAVVTDGPHAAAHAGPHGLVVRTPPEVVTRSLTGAGDVFVAAHLVARLDGAGPETALEAALAASAAHVSREAP